MDEAEDYPEKIKNRKKEHLEIAVSGDSAYIKTAGFERYDFIHNALPETDLQQVSCETRFLNRWFGFPLFIASMTGGHHHAESINAVIAAFCERHNLPFGVGSQRVMMSEPSVRSSFSVVRKEAPTAFIASNIGGTQIARGLDGSMLSLMMDCIRADAVIVHLNPLQELRQKGGDTDFRGVREGIRVLVKTVQIPVIVKETGAGLSASVIAQLIDCGVAAVDIAGSGGTSWARMENIRNRVEERHFSDDWGIPTVDCLLSCRDIVTDKCDIIASGGIRSSIDMAKSLCMGAVMASMAQPVVQAIVSGGYDQLERLYEEWQRDFRLIMCLLGCERPTDLDMIHLRKVDFR